MLTSCFDSEPKAAGDGFKLTDNSSKQCSVLVMLFDNGGLEGDSCCKKSSEHKVHVLPHNKLPECLNS